MSSPEKFVKKPVEIEAMQFTAETAIDVAVWCGGEHVEDSKPSDHTDISHALLIPTLEGVMIARPGWWIIKGVKGEFYPCAPDIFEATYEKKEQ